MLRATASPALAVALALMPESQFYKARQSDSWEIGGEDWPDAYRHCPMSRQEALAYVVAFGRHEWSMPAYQIYTGLLFGLSLAVTFFNCYNKFVEAAGRILAWVIISVCFDDSHLSDWALSPNVPW